MLRENRHETLRQFSDTARTSADVKIEWLKKDHVPFGSNALKNLAVASSLVLCAVVLRSGALPHLNDATDAVLTAVSNDTLLDDSLGKLSFVSSMFPEAVLVFGQQADNNLALPVSGGVIVHAWSENEPYTAWRSSSSAVYAGLDGEVIGVYHGPHEERLVHVQGEDGISCLYGNLSQVSVNFGDQVKQGMLLGQLEQGKDCILELRRNGYSIDPTAWMAVEQ